MHPKVRAGGHPRILASLVLAVGVATTMAACGSDGDTGSGGDSELTVAVGGSSVVLADVVVAEALGYFEDEGVDVDLQYLGPTASQAAIAGNVDLSYSTPTVTFSAIAAGRDVKTIWSSTLINTSMTVAVPADSDADDIADLSGKVLASYPAGSASYGNAVLLAEVIEEEGGEAPELRQLADATAIGTQLSAGRIDAGVAAGDFFAPLVAEGKVRILAGPDDFKDIPEYHFVNSGMFGLAGTLEDKSEQIQRFVNAMVKAAEFIVEGSTPEELAEILRDSGHGDYANQSAEGLAATLEASACFLDVGRGCLTQQAWDGTLSLAKGFELPLSGKSLDDAEFSFDSAVDTTFVEAAGSTC